MAATILSPSSSSPRGDDDRHIPTALALPAATAVVATAGQLVLPPAQQPPLRCPGTPPKTTFQCRHKMEKLRKRYRRAIASGGVRLYASSWAHFQGMDSMEKGFGGDPSSSSSDGEVFRDGVLGRNEIGKRASESVKRKKMDGKKMDGGSGSEVAATILPLGEGFMRMEKVNGYEEAN
ncbi:sequence-specific DNA binding transcription factors [Striga asiatica]|uniref:Sequence-specific DNA binding transcription factors n=1 Tax=Striga asiatica TaxID=4170 RepID=A0A5A7Q6A8_STRAF|nr:sequence-specific DNA binding transcription factors [Striga asiatica]